MSMGNSWRLVSIDNAVLAFQPKSGQRVRFGGIEEARLQAPLTILFGLTGSCDRRCHFCHREVRQKGAWTVETALAFLKSFAEAGSLEVAFGGGEPLLFEELDLLIERLHQETPLAIHLTTNGNRLTEARLARWKGRVGQLRLSLYADSFWQDTVRLLSSSGQQFGANLLVTPESLPRIPEIAALLADNHAHDLLFLNYLGPDPTLQLTPSQKQAVARLVPALPLPTAFSVCWGDPGLPARSLEGRLKNPCGAGRSFLTITADQKVLPCSFHRGGIPFQTPEEALNIWKQLQPAAAPTQGCSWEPLTEEENGIQSWQAFAGNNSGTYCSTGEFDSPEQASKLIEELKECFKQRRISGWEARLTAFVRKKYGIDIPPDQIFSNIPLEIQNEAIAEEDWPRLRGLGVPEARLQRRLGLDVEAMPDPHDLDVMLAVGHRILIYDNPTLYRFSGFHKLAQAFGGWESFLPWNDREEWFVLAAEFPDQATAFAVKASLPPAPYKNIVLLSWVTQKRLVVAGELCRALPVKLYLEKFFKAGGRVEGDFCRLAPDPELPTGPTTPGHTLLVQWGQRLLQELSPMDMYQWAGKPLKGSRRWPEKLQSAQAGYSAVLQAEHMTPLFVRGVAKRAGAVSWVERLPVWLAAQFREERERKRAIGLLGRRLQAGLLMVREEEHGVLRALVAEPVRAFPALAEAGATNFLLSEADPVSRLFQLLERPHE
jgi:MoaA/NifB/PqqE/SkfB family radical SAM enzyme